MLRFAAISSLLILSACGAERYAGTGDRWNDMMDCRVITSIQRGTPVRVAFGVAGGAIGGAFGGAVMGAASAIPGSERYSDAVDGCMAARGYSAKWRQ